MIQICSRCGTRWNVRDRQRVWCPRCQGTLLAPSADATDQQWAQLPGVSSTRTGVQTQQHTTQRAPAGYRWIAVRPGSAPPARHAPRPLGPTPRYEYIPRWGLVDQFDVAQSSATEPAPAGVRSGPSMSLVRKTVIVTLVLLGLAAIVQIGAYALLLVNRTTLLNPWVAGVATWLGVALSVLAAFAVVGSAVVLTNWLIARRSAAFANKGGTDHRSPWQLRAGCLIPVVNLFWAPTYLIELAKVEDRLPRMRHDIIVWWCVWALATVVCGFSIATSFKHDTQGIANNTVTTSIAYLLGFAALLLVARVCFAFERKAVDRPTKRWVMVPTDAAQDSPRESPVGVESDRREPAA